MNKFIDAEKLIAEIERRLQENADKALVFGAAFAGRTAEDNDLKNLVTSLQQEQPEVDYNKFETLFEDFCERNKGHHITSHDACMWFWELGLNARKV